MKKVIELGALTTYTRCACPEHADAVACFELRHFGYTPGPPRQRCDIEECRCVCHAIAREMRADDDEDWAE